LLRRTDTFIPNSMFAFCLSVFIFDLAAPPSGVSVLPG